MPKATPLPAEPRQRQVQLCARARAPACLLACVHKKRGGPRLSPVKPHFKRSDLDLGFP